MTSWVEQRFSHISPVTLQVKGGAMSSRLYCRQVGGLAQVESFLVELYRCKICQFTCGLKVAIGNHFLLHHDSSTLTCLSAPGEREEGGQASRGLQRMESPYQLDLSRDAKQSDEDEEFLLYNMLDNMSPPTCDISTEEGLQVAHTCEVSSLFEEEEAAVDISCPISPPPTQEDMDQSAHLMTLGLCRISSFRPPPAAPDACGRQKTEAPPPSRRRPCPLCPLTLLSRRLLDVHVRSHRAAGGFGCVRCSWTADSWEALEPHWRNRCRRRKRRMRSRRSASGRQSGDQSPAEGSDWSPTDRWAGQPTEPVETKGELPNRCVPASSQTVSSRNKKEQKAEGKQVRLTCSLCHRTFSSKLTLRRHLGVHKAERPFTCPHCPYSSRLKASLRQHLRTHTGEKPFRCSECSYASIDRSSLLRHLRTHSQEKPYRCQLCTYSSIQKKSLVLHARRHHTGEAFPCQQCDYSSPDRQLLLKHARRSHAPHHLAAL